MSSLQVLETYAVFVIVGIQIYFFINTKKKIALLSGIFPNSNNFEIESIKLKKEFVKLNPREIFSNLDELIEISNPNINNDFDASDLSEYFQKIDLNEADLITVDIIRIKENGNIVTKKIINAINVYLLKNRGVASDFHLIKDVAERNTNAVENEINQTISLPLYLGLLGTFLGIVVGLYQISGINLSSDPTGMDLAITTLLGGVKIAMIASFTGLFLTIANSGFFYKNAVVIVEDNKNEFYSFIQTDLLPVLNQGINSTLNSLHQNLFKFNEEFKSNVKSLSSVMGKNHDALIAQERILTTLDNIDISEFAKANVKVLKELQVSTEKFSQFNQYLDQTNEMLANSKQFAQKINEVIERTDNLNTLGKHIVETFERNKDLQLFLKNHYDSLDKSHQLISQSVNNVNNTLDESLDSLKDFTQGKIMEVQKLVNKEMELLEHKYPEKWQKLDNLSHLQSLNTNLNDIKFSSASQMSTLTNEMKEIKNNLNAANKYLNELNTNSNNRISTKFSKFISNKFNKKRLDEK